MNKIPPCLHYSPDSAEAVLAQAKDELDYEKWREAVAKKKQELLTRKPWYAILFPFKININIERI